MLHIPVYKKAFLASFILAITAAVALGLYFHSAYAASAHWYGSEWQHRTEITIDHTKVGAGLTGFPVYVNLSHMPSDFFASVGANGGDIRITESDGTTEVPREIVSVDTVSSTGELYFKAPALSNSANTSYYIYYDNPSASDYAATDTYGRNTVWSNYEAVLHMNSTTIVDSTGNGHVPIKNVGVTATNANGRPALYFNGSSYLDFGNQINMGLGNLSISAYVATKGTYVSFIAKSYYSGTDGRYSLLYSNADGGLVSLYDAGPDNRNTSYTGTFNDGNLRQIAVTYDRVGNNSLYMDGALRDTKPISNYRNYNFNGENHLFIGTYNDPSRGTSNQPMLNLTGKMREVRFSRDVLSADWLAAEYNNQTAPASFYTIGAPTDVPPTVSTGDTSGITNTTAEAAGSVDSNGGPTISSLGVVYGVNFKPTTADSMAAANDGVFSVTLTNLAPDTTYHYRTFAVNSAGTSYGEDRVFTTTPDAPTASFLADKTAGTSPLTVSFVNDSTGNPTSWEWDFGDGTKSASESPSHTYLADGVYTVSFTVTNAGGSTTEMKTDLVTVGTVTPDVTAPMSSNTTTDVDSNSGGAESRTAAVEGDSTKADDKPSSVGEVDGVQSGKVEAGLRGGGKDVNGFGWWPIIVAIIASVWWVIVTRRRRSRKDDVS